MNLFGDLIVPVHLLDKLRSLCIHTKLHRHFGRVWKRNIRSEWLVTARGYIEQFRRARGRLSTHFRGHAHASGDEHVAAKPDNRTTGKIQESITFSDPCTRDAETISLNCHYSL